MTRQRRSTLQMIGRLTLTIAVVASVHLGARLLFSWGVMRNSVYWYRANFYDQIVTYDGEGFYEVPPYDPGFWNMTPEMTMGGWTGLFGLHVLSALAIGVVFLIGFGIFKFIQWIVFEPSPEPEPEYCKDPSCKCIEHGDMVFDPQKGYWDYPSGGGGISSTAVIAAAAATTAAVVVASG